MTLRRYFSGLVAACLSLAAATAPAAELVSVTSRVAHGRQSFDLPLAVRQSAIEPRQIKSGLTLLLTFDAPLPAGALATIVGGKAELAGQSIAGPTMTLTLNKVADAQEIRLEVEGAGEAMQSVEFRTLAGDVNADAVVDEADVRLIKSHVGQQVNGLTARFDVGTTGAIDSADLTTARGRQGKRVEGRPFINTPPRITPITAQRGVAGQVSQAVSFIVSDNETPAAALVVTATSNNRRILPPERIYITGSGEQRSLMIEPIAGRAGSAVVTVRVSDGLASAAEEVEYSLESSPTLFVGRMTPQGGAATLGSGAATLLLAADELSAVLKFNYSNLTGPETAAHIHGPALPGESADILFDIDVATPNADGSYTWTFAPTGGHTAADQVNYVKQGKTYINIHTAAYPNGEIRGQFTLVVGSQVFSPPPTSAGPARYPAHICRRGPVSHAGNVWPHRT